MCIKMLLMRDLKTESFDNPRTNVNLRHVGFRQCFDSVGWVTRRASGP